MRQVLVHKKMCNLCGEDTEVYTVIDNAPICQFCIGTKERKKRGKIICEAEMIEKLMTKTTAFSKDSNQQLLTN